MADTLSEKLRGVAAFLAQVRGYNVDVLLEAAAALDRTEALEQALRKARNWLRSIDGTREMVEELDVALLALILPETKDPR